MPLLSVDGLGLAGGGADDLNHTESLELVLFGVSLYCFRNKGVAELALEFSSEPCVRTTRGQSVQRHDTALPGGSRHRAHGIITRLTSGAQDRTGTNANSATAPGNSTPFVKTRSIVLGMVAFAKLRDVPKRVDS